MEERTAAPVRISDGGTMEERTAASVRISNRGTMEERRPNAPVIISDKGSNALPHESSNVGRTGNSTENPKEKKKRGPSKLTLHYKGKQKCDEVDFNERNQPVGPESVKLSTLEGILARELVPITMKTWREVPENVKDKLWACVKVTFIIK